MSVVNRVKHMLMNYQLDDIRDVSAGAATFYVWVTNFLLNYYKVVKVLRS